MATAENVGLAADSSREVASGWYDNEPPDIKPEIKDIFEKYSKIPQNEILSHVQTIVQLSRPELARYTWLMYSTAR